MSGTARMATKRTSILDSALVPCKKEITQFPTKLTPPSALLQSSEGAAATLLLRGGFLRPLTAWLGHQLLPVPSSVTVAQSRETKWILMGTCSLRPLALDQIQSGHLLPPSEKQNTQTKNQTEQQPKPQLTVKYPLSPTLLPCSQSSQKAPPPSHCP